MDESMIIPYIEPIFRFCCNRLSNRYDAEDLAGEIICHILDGMRRYKIESFDAWVWRIAHNRYARFIDAQNKAQTVLAGDDVFRNIAASDLWDDDLYTVNPYAAEEEAGGHEYETVFRYLHTLSSEYRNIFVDYYIGEMSVRALSMKYSLPETTVKWRLNAGRQKIRKRIGENSMDKVYSRINWNTTSCNGSVDTDRYLHTQIARAICKAAYEKPLTVEEISISTGIPAMYIEDELPRLEYGDAVCKVGNQKYATNFIIFRLEDRKNTEDASGLLVSSIADKFEALLHTGASAVSGLDFYGHDFGMERLGYFLVPYLLRRKLEMLKSRRLKLENGPLPPRRDGGYGWFIVEETADESEACGKYETGCNVAGGGSTGRDAASSYIYYYWISKYFDGDIYRNRGTRWLCTHGIPESRQTCRAASAENGVASDGSNGMDSDVMSDMAASATEHVPEGMIKSDALSDEDAAKLIQNNLIVKAGDGYKLNFACFTEEQFTEFTALFDMEDEQLDGLLAEWIVSVRKSFVRFVPARLEDQINQWVSGYLFEIVGYVTDELIRRGVLKKPDQDKPLTDGVVYVAGRYIE